MIGKETEMEREIIISNAKSLIETTGIAVLATIDEKGSPDARAMLNLREKEQYPGLVEIFEESEEELVIYFVTSTESSKYGQMKARPDICAYYCNPAGFHGLMLAGKAELIEDGDLKERIWRKGWEIYYPGGPTDPMYGVVKLVPQRAKGWYQDGPFDISLNGDTE
jgi:general stress protein 26